MVAALSYALYCNLHRALALKEEGNSKHILIEQLGRDKVSPTCNLRSSYRHGDHGTQTRGLGPRRRPLAKSPLICTREHPLMTHCSGARSPPLSKLRSVSHLLPVHIPSATTAPPVAMLVMTTAPPVAMLVIMAPAERQHRPFPTTARRGPMDLLSRPLQPALPVPRATCAALRGSVPRQIRRRSRGPMGSPYTHWTLRRQGMY